MTNIKRKMSSSFSKMLVILMLAIIMMTTACTYVKNNEKDDEYKLNLPPEEQYALNRYDEDALKDVMVTMRRDIFNITERNIARPSIKELSNVFTYADSETGQSISADFAKYPNKADNFNLDKTYKDTLEGANFYKYMLLRQGEALMAEYKAKYLEQSITQSNLYKHPGIDEQFGAVEGENNAVKSEIIIDSSYRSLHTTGLYMPAGELVSFKVEGLKKGESINVVLNRQADGYFNQSEEYYRKNDALIVQKKYSEVASLDKLNKVNRLPTLTINIPINKNNEVFYGNPFGGIIHVDISRTTSPIKITITGAVETPHYILGVTTPEYFQKYLQNAPGVISALDTENGILIGPNEPMKAVSASDIENLALLWHSFFAVNESFTGGSFDANNLVLFDRFVPAGDAVYLGGGVSVCPSGWYDGAMNYQNLLRYGSWGILHEVGHGNASAYGSIWGLGGKQESEVRNNAIIALCYLMLGDMGTYHGQDVEHGFVVHPYDSLKFTLEDIPTSTADFNNVEYFGALSSYTNLMHAFGTDKFYELMYSYEENPKYCDNKRADFIYRCGLVYGFDFTYYFNDLFYCNVTDDMFSVEQLSFIKSRPQYIPIANYNAGGIDGVKTGGDNLLVHGQSFNLDLKGQTISPKSFTILGVSQPKYGSVSENADGTYTYKTSSSYNPTDEFSFTVKQENDVVHTFNISFRIQLTGSTAERYENVDARNIDDALGKISSASPNTSFFSGNAGVSRYNSTSEQGNVLDVSDFVFQPDRDGDFSFYLKADDIGRLLYSSNNIDFTTAIDLQSYTSNYDESKVFIISLKKGVSCYFRIYTLNTGGLGFSSVGMKKLDGTIVDIPSALFYPSSVSLDDLSRANNYNPPKQSFLVSKKHNILSSSLISNKPEWEVLSAPNAQGGNTYVEKIEDEDGNIISETTRNKTDFIIDGFTNTEYHSIYNGENRTPMPHVYTIDMKIVQPVNYYKIYTRNNVNSYIYKYELLYSTDNVNYISLSNGESLEYKSLCATINFKQIDARYFKLVIYTTSGSGSGDYFSVLTELDAGITAQTEKIVPSTSSKLFMTSGWGKSANYSNLQTGMAATNKKNEKMVIKFTGDRVALYSTLNKDYGAANIFIDGKKIRSVNLDSDEMISRQLIFTQDGLEIGEHTLEIITTKEGVFNVGFIGLSYAGALVAASNIYLEKALIITIIVFIFLFLLICAFVLLLYFVPPFRKLFLSDKLLAKIEKNYEQSKINRKNKKDEQKILKDEEDKKTASQREVTITPRVTADNASTVGMAKTAQREVTITPRVSENKASTVGVAKTANVKGNADPLPKRKSTTASSEAKKTSTVKEPKTEVRKTQKK